MNIKLTHGFYADGKPFSPKNYLHKYSKEVLLNWFKNDGTDKNNWDYTESFKNIGPFRPNRTCGVWKDYPIVIDKTYNSIDENWDENIFDDDVERSDLLRKIFTNGEVRCEFVPTIEECEMLNVKIIKLMDLVISHKGRPALYIHLYDKKRMSAYEINELRKCEITNLIEINVRWIMSQTKKPDILEFFQLIEA